MTCCFYKEILLILVTSTGHQTGNKPLTEPKMFQFNEGYMWPGLSELTHWSLWHHMAWWRFMINDGFSSIRTSGKYVIENIVKTLEFHARKCIWKSHLLIGSHIFLALMCQNTPEVCHWLCHHGFFQASVKLNTLRPRQDGHHFCRWHFHMHFLEWKLLNFK